MSSITDESLAYEPSTARNISELDRIDLSLDVQTFDGANDEGKAFTYKYVEVAGQRYRMPVSVLKQLKVHLEVNPKLVAFRVKKSGEGLATEYTVIPLL